MYVEAIFLDPDLYPTNLCEKCAEALRNAHILFEKALESYKSLQNLHINTYNKFLHGITNEFEASDTVKTAEELMKTDEKSSLLNLNANEKLQSEDRSINLNKVDTSKISTLKPTHFIDIQNFKSSVEMPFEEHFSELSDSKVPISFATKKLQRKRKKRNSVLLASLVQNEASDISSCNTKKTSKRKRTNEDCKTTHIEIAEDVSKADNLENLELKSIKAAKKSREKYLFMCSYCCK